MNNKTIALAQIDLAALANVSGGGVVCQKDVDFLNGLDPSSPGGRSLAMFNSHPKQPSIDAPFDDVGPRATQNNVNAIAAGLSDMRMKLSGRACPE